MLFGSICDIYKVGIERLACGESKWRLKSNMMNLGEKRCATRKGGVPDVECRVGKRSDDGDGGVRNEIGGRKSKPRSAYPAEQPIHAEHHRKRREVESLE